MAKQWGGKRPNAGRKTLYDQPKQKLTLSLEQSNTEFLNQVKNRSCLANMIISQSANKSKILLFCELFKQNGFTENDWQKFSREILNSSRSLLVQDESFFSGLLMQIRSEKSASWIEVYRCLGDLFYSYFWEDLKGDFASFQERREGIKAMIKVC